MRQLFSLRKPLRQYCSHLNREQRRAWMTMRLERSCRVPIGTAHVPRNVARAFTYVKVS